LAAIQALEGKLERIDSTTFFGIEVRPYVKR